jgi:hypothetical protein
MMETNPVSIMPYSEDQPLEEFQKLSNTEHNITHKTTL